MPPLRSQYSEPDVPGSPRSALQQRLAEAASCGRQPSLWEQHSEPHLAAMPESVSSQQPVEAASCGLQPCLPIDGSGSNMAATPESAPQLRLAGAADCGLRYSPGHFLEGDVAATPESAVHQWRTEAASCGPATSLRAEYSGSDVATPGSALRQPLKMAASSGLQPLLQAQQSHTGMPLSPAGSSQQQLLQAAAEHRPVLRSDLLAEHLRQYVADPGAWGGAPDGGGQPSEAVQSVQADDAGAVAPGRGEVGLLQPGVHAKLARPKQGKRCIAPAVLRPLKHLPHKVLSWRLRCRVWRLQELLPHAGQAQDSPAAACPLKHSRHGSCSFGCSACKAQARLAWECPCCHMFIQKHLSRHLGCRARRLHGYKSGQHGSALLPPVH